MLAFIGTYTASTGSAGIYAASIAEGGRTVELLAENGAIENPSWLTRHPALPVIYAVSETSLDGAGGVSAFSFDQQGRLTPLSAVSSFGADPCHLAIDGSASRLYVSNYSGGNFAVYALLPDGSIGEMLALVQHAGSSVDPVRQNKPHVHSIALDEASNQVFVADLGADKLLAYPGTGTGKGTGTGAGVDVVRRKSYRTRPGAGPRLACLDPAGDYLWLINELDNSIVAYGLAAGALTELVTVPTLPADYIDASYCAHIAVSRDGRFLYASNRGHDSITVFGLEDGRPVPQQWQGSGGRHPRHFCLSPDEAQLLVANRDDNNICIFDRDANSGLLGDCHTQLTVPAPVCILFADPVR